MTWNWKLPKWPQFSWDAEQFVQWENHFLENRGVIIGATAHLSEADKNTVTIELMSIDALTTSEIEGEYLNRESVQSSLRRALGLKTERRHATEGEVGIAEMMVDLYRSHQHEVTEKMLSRWHEMIMSGRRDVICIGMYRAHADEIQIISGAGYEQRVHFVAPPTERVSHEMSALLQWINHSSLESHQQMGPIVRAGIAHLWFECIHPFEDGNGRIGRGIAEKILAEGAKFPVVTGLAKVMLKRRREYYAMLAKASTSLEVTEWLHWFAEIALEAQKNSLNHITFIINKTKLMDRVREHLNARQEKALSRMFQEGPEGFLGGMSAAKYIKITDTTTPTATRDLHDLVEKKALIRKGERKSTRYYLPF